MGFLTRLFNLGKSNADEDTDLPDQYHLADLEVGFMLKYQGYDWIVNEVSTGKDFYLPYVDLEIISDLETHRHIAVSNKYTRVYEQMSIGAAIDQQFLTIDPRRKIAADEPPKEIVYNNVTMLKHAEGLCRYQDIDYLCFEYINKQETSYLWFQQWSDTDFSLCVGVFDNQKSFEILGPTETPF